MQHPFRSLYIPLSAKHCTFVALHTGFVLRKHLLGDLVQTYRKISFKLVFHHTEVRSAMFGRGVHALVCISETTTTGNFAQPRCNTTQLYFGFLSEMELQQNQIYTCFSLACSAICLTSLLADGYRQEKENSSNMKVVTTWFGNFESNLVTIFRRRNSSRNSFLLKFFKIQCLTNSLDHHQQYW